MMKLKDFLNKLELAYVEPNYYLSGGWGKWNGSKWGWDCCCLIKGILWGWNNDIAYPRGGGAIYGSNGVPDIGTESLINVCNDVSSTFTRMKIGQMVWMPGHVGICTKSIDETGYGEITEATIAFGWSGIIKTRIDKNGNRTMEGRPGYYSNAWVKFGYLPYIDYTDDISPGPYIPDEIKVGDWVTPIRCINYYGVPVKQYDEKYRITQLEGNRAVLSALRNNRYIVWASMNIKDIKKV